MIKTNDIGLVRRRKDWKEGWKNKSNEILFPLLVFKKKKKRKIKTKANANLVKTEIPKKEK